MDHVTMKTVDSIHVVKPMVTKVVTEEMIEMKMNNDFNQFYD